MMHQQSVYMDAADGITHATARACAAHAVLDSLLPAAFGAKLVARLCKRQ